MRELILVPMSVLANLGMLAVLNLKGLGNRGETTPPPVTPPVTSPVTEGDKSFTQDQVNSIVANATADLKRKVDGFGDLKKFKEEHEAAQSEAEKKRLEDAGKYDEAKKGYEVKINEYEGVVSKQQASINDMKVGYAVQGEVVKQNAYPAAADLIKSLAVIQEDGSIKIKGKNASGIDDLLSVEEGISQFLKTNPYLIKAGNQGGSGSGTGAGQGGTGSGAGTGTGEDLNSLNNQLAAAMTGGNHKLADELGKKIKALQISRGVSSMI